MPTDLTTILTYGTFLVLCVVYLIYVTIGFSTFNRLLDRKCRSITIADVGIALPSHSGTVHSMSYLISNPLQLADGRRLQSLGIFDQIAFGVRHLHVELYAKLYDTQATENDNNGPVTNVDGRVRTLAYRRDLRSGGMLHRSDVVDVVVVVYLLVNGTMTEYNVLDFIDQLHEYGKRFVALSRRPTAIHLWIGGIRLLGNLDDVDTTGNDDAPRSRRTIIGDRLYDRLRDYVERMKFSRQWLKLERASDETWFGRSIGNRIDRGTEWEAKVIWFEHLEDKISLFDRR